MGWFGGKGKTTGKRTGKTRASMHRPLTFREMLEDPETREQFRQQIEQKAEERGVDPYKRLETMTVDEITDEVVHEIRSRHIPVPVTRTMVRTQVLWFLDEWRQSDEYRAQHADNTDTTASTVDTANNADSEHPDNTVDR